MIRGALIPLSSLLTVGVVGYITYAYINSYLPCLVRNDPANAKHFDGKQILDHNFTVSFSIYLKGAIFVLFPIFIHWALFAICCGDPGHVNKKMI